MTTTSKKLATGELALKVFTDALHHDEALRDPYRVPKRLHDDMVSALDDLRDLLADRDDSAQRLAAVQMSLVTTLGALQELDKWESDGRPTGVHIIMQTVRAALDKVRA